MPIYPLKWLLVFVLSIWLVGGCAQKKAPPSKLPYSKDLINKSKYYKVKQGDTLYSIGFRSGHGYKRLASWNNIRSPYKIRVGETIKLFKPWKASSKKNKTPKSKYSVQNKKKLASKRSNISKVNKNVLRLSWQWPIRGKILRNFSQTGKKGIDIYGKLGQTVKSAAGGKVVYSGQGLIGYGNLLIVKHNDNYLSAYANNRRLLVKEGQQVKKGQAIAEVGKGTGNKTSLHFEIRKNGKPVNPIRYLPK